VVDNPDRRWSLDADWSTLHTGSGLVLAFQRVKDYRPPRWPDPANRSSSTSISVSRTSTPAQERVLDVGATLLDDGEGRRTVEHSGAERHDERVGAGQGWRVYADPAGHPFCLVRG
jgi:Glyoxalase-like domain